MLVDARQDVGVAWADDDEGLARVGDVFRPRDGGRNAVRWRFDYESYSVFGYLRIPS